MYGQGRRHSIHGSGVHLHSLGCLAKRLQVSRPFLLHFVEGGEARHVSSVLEAVQYRLLFWVSIPDDPLSPALDPVKHREVRSISHEILLRETNFPADIVASWVMWALKVSLLS